jgi:hypothetical protein
VYIVALQRKANSANAPVDFTCGVITAPQPP